MSLPIIAEFALFLLIVAALVRPVGGYLTRVFTGQRTWLALALAGIFVGQRRRPATLGTLPTDSFQFGVVIVGTAVLVGALTFFPAYALAPAIEHLRMVAGR